MKIIQIINSLGTGGAEKLLLDTIPKYNAAGITMDLLVLWDNQHPFLAKLIAQNICKVYVLNSSTNVKDVYAIKNIKGIKEVIAAYDIAHVHLFPAQYFVPLANRLLHNKLPLIFTEHNTSNRRIAKSWLRPIERYCYKRYQQLICISENIKDIYQKYLGFDDSYYKVIPNGVDLQAIQSAPSIVKQQIVAGLQEQDVVLLQVAAFRPQKDQATAIKAMQHLPNHYKLLLAGDGSTRPAMELLVKELKLEQRVFFLGQRMDVHSLLKSVDVVIMSTHYEGVSLACIEAMASGRPFVASDVPGVREMVVGVGALFPLGDDQKLATIIQEIISDPPYQQSIIKACQERAQAYDINNMIQQHIQLYQEVYETNKGY